MICPKQPLLMQPHSRTCHNTNWTMHSVGWMIGADVYMVCLGVHQPASGLYACLQTRHPQALFGCLLMVDSLTDTQKAELDSMASYLYKNYCQSGMCQYPQVDFSNGLTSLKEKTADEETGATFVVCAVVHCKEAFKMIDNHTQKVDAQLNTFEMLLCFEQSFYICQLACLSTTRARYFAKMPGHSSQK